MLGQLRIFERSHLNKVSFELHLPWRVGVTPFFYKTGCTSQSCQKTLINFIMEITRLLFNGSEASIDPNHARVLWSLI